MALVVRPCLQSSRIMTLEALKHIQAICREWLAQSALSCGIRLTILPGGPLVQTVEVELRAFITPDNTTITSAVDMVTGAKYVSVMKRLGMEEIYIDAALEEIPRSVDEKLLPAGNPPPIKWNFDQYRGPRESEPDPVNEEFPLITIGDRVFVLDGWDLEERGFGIVRDILTTTYPYPTYLVEIDGKISWETRYDLILVSE